MKNLKSEERSTDLPPARDIVLTSDSQDLNTASEKVQTHDTDDAIVDETITDGNSEVNDNFLFHAQGAISTDYQM